MNELLPINHLVNCKGTLLDLSQPRVMGILNMTPDSFFDGGQNSSTQALLDKAGGMIEDGATFLDIGGVSTRPGAKEVAEQEELDRVLPAFEALQKHFPGQLLSIDSWRASVVQAAAIAGASLVNDISGGQFDKSMWATVGKLNLPYIFMHTQGKPQHMQDKPSYNQVSLEICDYFALNISKLKSLGIKDIIIDPGFGFGKTVAHNYQLLNDLSGFRILGCPILIGLSRKSMIYKTLGGEAKEALHGTTAAHMLALQNGTSILRVHDVKPAMDCIKIFKAYQDQQYAD